MHLNILSDLSSPATKTACLLLEQSTFAPRMLMSFSHPISFKRLLGLPKHAW
ncbi:hypothetical protein GLYMA_07G077500v4 [Glycine max]|uniref:Uncharacterized protein n=1 Tax=Glycine max TaxID=3847 RepID=K7L0A2_SOYBN|nr:hypothetical protein GYH30_017716 [Glycine max]KRH48243.1 hypothetical protein GLYMA_07G077500v4 [Glycine max]